MAISLRQVSPGDLATIDRWASGIGSNAPSRTRPLDDAADRHDPASGLFWYLVVEDAREVGTVWIERPPGEGRARLGVFLGRPSDFGRGIGREALQLAIAEFREAFPDEPIALHVRRSNERAMRCYRSVGFEVIDTGSKASPSGEAVAFYTVVRPSHELAADSPDTAFEQTRRS
jgi:ribosomal protein S18 acetylase RimI-like enzyme